jgi:hypothetical protein
MVEIRKIEKWKELDAIIPMLIDFHKGNKVYRIYPLSGFLSWLTFNFVNPNLGVFGVYSDDKLVGYSICEIGWKWMEKTCTIIDAVFVENREELAPALEKVIIEWAKTGGCTTLEAVTTRVEAMERKYGAECTAGIIIRKLED